MIAVVVWAVKQISMHLLTAWEVFGVVEMSRITAVLGDWSRLHTGLSCAFH